MPLKTPCPVDYWPGLCCGSRLRKGEVFAYVGRIHNLKDLKGPFGQRYPIRIYWSAGPAFSFLDIGASKSERLIAKRVLWCFGALVLAVVLKVL